MNPPSSGLISRSKRTTEWRVRLAGTMVCLLAMFLSLGGHWLLLQSVAWTRMIADFSRDDSVAVAVAKTFSGDHPCNLCLEIQTGRQQEQEEQRERPLLAPEKSPELICVRDRVEIPLPLGMDRVQTPIRSGLSAQFILGPPKPPPRGGPRGVWKRGQNA